MAGGYSAGSIAAACLVAGLIDPCVEYWDNLADIVAKASACTGVCAYLCHEGDCEDYATTPLFFLKALANGRLFESHDDYMSRMRILVNDRILHCVSSSDTAWFAMAENVGQFDPEKRVLTVFYNHAFEELYLKECRDDQEIVKLIFPSSWNRIEWVPCVTGDDVLFAICASCIAPVISTGSQYEDATPPISPQNMTIVCDCAEDVWFIKARSNRQSPYSIGAKLSNMWDIARMLWKYQDEGDSRSVGFLRSTGDTAASKRYNEIIESSNIIYIQPSEDVGINEFFNLLPENLKNSARIFTYESRMPFYGVYYLQTHVFRDAYTVAQLYTHYVFQIPVS
jgi:hypothetical protein